MAVGGWDREDEVATAELTGYPNKPQIDDGDWCAGVRVLRAGLDPARGRSYRTDRTCDAGSCDMRRAGRAGGADLSVRTTVLGRGM